jgi:diaminopimelate decarboxylase
VAVDGGMSDNLRPMLYGARYEAHVADRFGGTTRVRARGQALRVRRRDRARRAARRPAARRRVVTPATGAYGHAMANNYNGVPRPPVIFCRTARRAWSCGARARRPDARAATS